MAERASLMPVLDYRAYAKSPKGKAARARAHARYVEKRRAAKLKRINPAPLAQAITQWRTS